MEQIAVPHRILYVHLQYIYPFEKRTEFLLPVHIGGALATGATEI